MIQRAKKKRSSKPKVIVTRELVKKIERLFREENASIKSVSKNFGIGYETATAIRDGYHRLQIPTEYVRCRGCGGMVLLPCLTCQVRGVTSE